MNSYDSQLRPLDTFVMGLLKEYCPAREKDSVRLVVDQCYGSYGGRSPSKQKFVSLVPIDRWDNATSRKHQDKCPPSPTSPTSSRWESQTGAISSTTAAFNATSPNRNNQGLPPLQPKRKKSHIKVEVTLSERMFLDSDDKQHLKHSSSQSKLTLPIVLRTLPYAT
jgi:hypothetical protein